ncbi:hypothetical protein, partial [Coprococcus sp. RTP31081st1_H3_RTP31081_211007]|uniref:hypothetical protein n=1 Tax=Coprococcus sp. RTP31081st1_H3_RTP31081_211007 TaxID=3153679 RepID=UPI0032ECEE11
IYHLELTPSQPPIFSPLGTEVPAPYSVPMGTEVPDPIQDIKEAGNVVTAVRLYIHEYVNFYATH